MISVPCQMNLVSYKPAVCQLDPQTAILLPQQLHLNIDCMTDWLHQGMHLLVPYQSQAAAANWATLSFVFLYWVEVLYDTIH